MRYFLDTFTRVCACLFGFNPSVFLVFSRSSGGVGISSHWLQWTPVWVAPVAFQSSQTHLDVPWNRSNYCTENFSYNLTQQLSPSCLLGMARKLLWFTSGMATCRVSTVNRLVFSIQLFFTSGAYDRSSETQLRCHDKPGFPWALDSVLPQGTCCWNLQSYKLFATSHSL